MKITNYLLAIALFFAISVNLEAQKVEEKVKEKVEQAADAEVDNAIDDAVNKGVDKLKGLFKKKRKKSKKSKKSKETQKRESKDTDGIPGVEIDVETESEEIEIVENEFIGSFTMISENYKKGKLKATIESDIAFDKTRSAMRIKNTGSTMLIIFNNAERTMTTVPDVEGKQAMKMKQPKAKLLAKDEYTEAEVKVTRTNETKKIDGHECVKYLIETPDANITAWIDESIDVDLASAFQSMSFSIRGKKNEALKGTNFFGVKGLMRESHYVDKNGKDENKMYIKDFQQGEIDDKIFDLSSFKVMDLSAF